MPFSRVCLFGTTALATLGGAAAMLATVGVSEADAACTLQSGLGETVTCLPEFDATLTFDPFANQLTLDQGETVDTVITDLSGNDTISLSDANVIQEEPPSFTIPSGEIVFVRDASCGAGGVRRLIGGNQSQGIPRQSDCVINTLQLETLTTTAAAERLDLAGGNDTVSVNTGRLIGTIIGGAGEDSYSVLRDGIVFLDPTAAVLNGVAFSGGLGNDTVTIGSGVELFFRLLGDDGIDTFNIDGTIGVPRNPNFSSADPFGLDGGAGNDIITMGEGSAISGIVGGGLGDDTINFAGTTVPFDFDDNITIAGGFGNDRINVLSSAIIEGVRGDSRLAGTPTIGTDNDIIDIALGASVDGSVFGGFGNDTITSAGTLSGNIEGGGGNDTVSVFGGAVTTVYGDDGPTSNGTGPEGADNITIGAGAVVNASVLGGVGNDTITSAGAIGGIIAGEAGDDNITVSGGIVLNVLGDDGSVTTGAEGVDSLTFSGGEITGVIAGFETLLADETLSEAPFTDFAFDVFGSDLGSDITVANTNLLREEFSDLPDVFNINTLTQTNSVIPIFSPQDVQQWFVRDNSTLVVTNNVNMGGTALTVEDSTLSLVDNDPTDVFTVNSLAMFNGVIAVDVAPQESEPVTEPISPGLESVGAAALTDGSGQIVAVSDTVRILNPTENAFQGQNVVQVNFTAPVTEPGLIIPIATIIDEPTPGASDALAQNFTAEILNPELAPLVALSLLQGPQGGLFLRTEANATVITPPPVTNNTTTVFTTDAIREVNADLIDNEIGFSIAGPTGPAQITPDFGVYANGSFGHIMHDGFDVTGPGGPELTPSFTANNFSLIVTGEADATAALGVDNEDIGVKASIFGGYVNSDVTLDRAVPGGGISPFEGSGSNNGGVLGATVLASRIVGEGDLNYGLLAAAGFLGNTEVVNANTGGEGDYDTRGFILSAKMGRNMAVRDRLRVDMRFGASYAAFYGDSFIDSTNVSFGDTSTSFGLLTFEPGISTAFLVGERVVSPSARLLFHQRLGYSNEAEVNGADFDFDDSDFTLGAQIGANVRITERLSAGAFLEGRVTEDQRSVLAKLAVKYVFSKN